MSTPAVPPLASGAEILRSFDARDWARHFVAHVRQNPGIATDEETMATWFANALMRGYDEAKRDAVRQASR
jgi:ADP-ribosylglycohydrolase